jgi:hypothetical protein
MHCLEVIIKRNQEAAEKEETVKKMVVWSTLIPTHDNDGNTVSDETRDAIFKKVEQFFGGYTLDAVSHGVYVSESGERFLDFHRRLTVACDDSKINDAKGLVRFICHLLCQKTMPFFYNGTMELIS